MIEVFVRSDGITVSGHARYAPSGQDIVCAAVTALTQTLIKAFESLTTDKITYEISLGRVDIHYGYLTETGRLLIDAFLSAFARLPMNFLTTLKFIDRKCHKTIATDRTKDGTGRKGIIYEVHEHETFWNAVVCRRRRQRSRWCRNIIRKR